jgi:PBP1b-binding outer membrane lipoprotein LpoB
MKRLALLAIMALTLAACGNSVEKKEENKSTTEMTQPAAEESNKAADEEANKAAESAPETSTTQEAPAQ